MPKKNLVLLPSFPTNSVLLKGLIQYLDDYMNVYFIDLPGFICDTPPLTKINLNNYSNFVESKLRELNLKEYYLGGISFGFLIANNVRVGKNCKGIFAIEPYTGYQSLKMSIHWRYITIIFLSVVNFLNLSNFFWQNVFFRRFYSTYIFKGHPKKTTDCILTNMNGKTFVETALLLLTLKEIKKFHKLPHALIINKEDIKVSYTYLTELFKNSINRLLIVDTKIEHYPKRTLLKSYFESKLPKQQVLEVLKFFSNQEKIDVRLDVVSEISYNKA